MKILVLALAIFATVLLTAPPTFARVDEPMFGIDWTPDVCYGGPGAQICADVFGLAMIAQNNAIDDAWDACNGGNGDSCFVAVYSGYMGNSENFVCSAYGDEVNSWCVEVYEQTIRDTLLPYQDCSGNCLNELAKPFRRGKGIPTGSVAGFRY